MCKKWSGRIKVDRVDPPQDLVPITRNVAGTAAVLNYILAHAQGDRRPHLEVKIYGIVVKGLLDSGCTNTVIGNRGWEQLKRHCKLHTSSVQSCSVANGDSCEVIGSVLIPIQLRDTVKLFEVLVVPSLPHSLILGVDFWVTMQIIPDLNSGEWHFRKDCNEEYRVNALEEFEHLSLSEKRQLNELVERTFSKMGDRLGCTNLVEHVITTNSAPIKQRHYPLSPALQVQVNKEVEKMLADDIIEPSNSPWASPIVLVKKPDGSYRFCVNYKKLNEVSLPDAYPLPFISSTLDKLREAKYLSTIDIKSAYWQIPVAKESRPLTAFVVPTRGLFQFKRMPFGLHNAPSTWQRFLDRVLGHDLEKYISCYLDDIIISTSTFPKHLEVLAEVFKRLTEAGLTLNRDKCKFGKSELKFLGHIVTAAGLMVDPEKIEAVVKIPNPKSVTDVRRIVGLASWYRRFVPNFSSVVAPLTNLLRKNQPFVWSEECSTALAKLKDHLISAPILACPDFSKPFYVQTDASDFGLGAVLTQFQEDGEKVICYLSRSLTKIERRYSVTEKECLSVIFAVEKLRGYLEGSRFTVITDHYSLKWLFSIKDPIGRIARWAVRLQQYDFEIVHRSGKDNVVPDVLSRSVPIVDSVESTILIPTTPAEDKWYSKIFKRVKDNPQQFPLWRVENNRLYKRAKIKYPDLNEHRQWLLVIPKEHRRNLIQQHHDPPTSGHLGIHKTLHRLSGQYYWPMQKADVSRYIRHCEVCMRTKPEQKAPIGHMLSLPATSRRPWQIISIDLVGPLPRSSSGYTHIFSMLDCFSKFVLLFPLRSATASKVTQILEEQILLFGAPEKIISDNGVQFKSRLFQQKVEEYGIKLAYTAHYHPQGNPVERVHRVIKTMLSAYVKEKHTAWDKYLSKIGWALRSATHEVTDMTPNFVFFGRELNITGNTPLVGQDYNAVDPVIRSNCLKEVYQDVRDRLKKAYEKRKHTYNLRRRDEQFALNQKVWRRNYTISDASKQFASKLAPKFVGPFVVSKIVSPYTYELQDLAGKSCGIWNAKDIKAHPPDSDL